MTRIAICGGPRTGKSTFASKLATELGIELFSTGKKALVATDNFMDVGWENVPRLVMERLLELDDWILEGTQATRVIRHWYRTAPETLQLDRVYFFERPWVVRNGGQNAMAKGVQTIWREVRAELHKRGIPILYGVDYDERLGRRAG
jgi:hypothetical protein